MKAEWVIAISNVVMALGVMFVALQCKFSFAQLNKTVETLKADHERSRREKSIDLLSYWDSRLTRNGALARKLVETLGFEESKALLNSQGFSVNRDHFELFVGALPSSMAEARLSLEGEDAEDGFIKVTNRESAAIRWSVVSYLNQLETSLSAVRNNVADKEMIYEQFRYLVSPADDHYVLEDFRKAAGGSVTYPSIEYFVQELKNLHSVPMPGKEPIA